MPRCVDEAPFFVGLSYPFAGGGLLLKGTVLSCFAGLLSGHRAGVLPAALGNFQNGAGVVGVMWLVGSFAVVGSGAGRLKALGAGVCIGKPTLPYPDIRGGEDPAIVKLLFVKRRGTGEFSSESTGSWPCVGA